MKSKLASALLAVLLLATCSSLPAAELPAPAQPAESAINAAAPEAPLCLRFRQPAKQVVDLLTTVNSRSSDFLINVGPNKQGPFKEASVKVLAEVGVAVHAGDSGAPK